MMLAQISYLMIMVRKSPGLDSAAEPEQSPGEHVVFGLRAHCLFSQHLPARTLIPGSLSLVSVSWTTGAHKQAHDSCLCVGVRCIELQEFLWALELTKTYVAIV